MSTNAKITTGLAREPLFDAYQVALKPEEAAVLDEGYVGHHPDDLGLSI